jgi:hypothetical protein
MQYTVPTPSLSSGTLSAPVIDFEGTVGSLAAEAIRTTCILKKSNTNINNGLSIHLHDLSTLCLIDPNDGIEVQEGYFLALYADFSACLYRHTDNKHRPYELFYHPLRISCWIKPKSSILHTDYQKPQSLFLARASNSDLSNAIDTCISEIIDFWEVNPTFDYVINEQGPTNLAWATPVATVSAYIEQLNHEIACLIEAYNFNAPRKVNPLDGIYYAYMRRLNPNGETSKVHLISDTLKRTPEQPAQLHALTDWVEAGLSDPECPITKPYQIWNPCLSVQITKLGPITKPYQIWDPRLSGHGAELGLRLINPSKHEAMASYKRATRSLQEITKW